MQNHGNHGGHGGHGSGNLSANLSGYQSRSVRSGGNQGQSGGNNLMDELKKYLDIFQDYATIRIYWKFYGDKNMSEPAHGNHDPRNL